MDIQQTFEKYIKIFEAHSPQLKAAESELVFETRLKAFEKFKKYGIPDHKDENYKYAGISEICSQDYEFSLDSRNALVDLNAYFQCEVEDMDTHVVLLSNGRITSYNVCYTKLLRNPFSVLASLRAKAVGVLVAKGIKLNSHESTTTKCSA